MGEVAQQLSDAANELAEANARPMQIRALDAKMDELIGDEDLGHVLQSIARVCKARVTRDWRRGYTSANSWQEAADTLETAASDLGNLDFEGERIEEDPPCRGCRIGSEVCTC
jgi:hypothetical protein